MLRLSWGKRIAILYIGFVALIIVMISMSMRQKVELVSDDYYDRELAFQEKIDEMNNAERLSEKVTFSISENSFFIQFPSQFKTSVVEGEIVFFRPSDATKDFKSKIQLDRNAKQQIDIKNLCKGMYKMQISWNVNNIPYSVEETIVIP